MWKLSIEDDQGNKTDVSLVKDEYSIGRAEDNAVRLTERNISRHHARLRNGADGWVLEDLDSYNGAYVNGARVAGSEALAHGVLIQLGDYRLGLHDDALVAGAQSKVQTVPSSPRSQAQALIGQPDRLVMLVGPTPGAEYPINTERVVIGRGEECDIAINHPSVSRVHAEIQSVGNGRYEVIDRESANGLRVNGAELARSLIDQRDIIDLGDVRLKYIPAGQIYRPEADASQQLSALTADAAERISAPGVEASPRGGMSSAVKVAAALGGLGLLVVLGMVTLGGSSDDGSSVTAEADDTAKRILDEAKKLADQGKLDDAHAKLSELPPTSNLRSSGEFRRIEEMWADSLIARAEKTSDPAVKRAILDKVAKSTTVPSTARKRAANAIAALDRESVDVDDLDEAPQPMGTASGSAKSGGEAAAGGLVRDNPFDKPGPKQAAAPAPKPTATKPTKDALSGERAKLLRSKAMYEAKANAGTATAQDLRILKGLCGQLGDMACRQRAAALLAQKSQ